MKETFKIRNVIIAVLFSAIILWVILLAGSGVDTEAQYDVENPANPVESYINFSTSEQRVEHLLSLYKIAESNMRRHMAVPEFRLQTVYVRTRIIGELREEYRLQEASLYR